MKKLILIIAVVLGTSIIVTSCKDKEHKHEDGTTHAEHDDEKGEMAMADVYQCPMDCEKGKTYDKAGQCSVCKMDMKKVDHEDNDEGHNEDLDNEEDKEDHD